ncbi:MAG: hypothetical protein ABI690_21990 [Chloroflexota bacterium]
MKITRVFSFPRLQSAATTRREDIEIAFRTRRRSLCDLYSEEERCEYDG